MGKWGLDRSQESVPTIFLNPGTQQGRPGCVFHQLSKSRSPGRTVVTRACVLPVPPSGEAAA